MVRRRSLGPGPVQFHRGGAERAADLARGGGAGDPAVAVGVIGGDRAELVLCQLGCLCVVRGCLLFGGGGARRPEFQQRFRRGRAVQASRWR